MPPAKSNLATRNKKRDQQRLLDALEEGISASKTMEKLGKSYSTYNQWMRDPDFAEKVKAIKDRRLGYIAAKDVPNEPMPVPDFPTFCRDFMHQPLFEHQLRWVDMMEGRAPRNLHPSMTHVKGRANRLMTNIPPGHAKSTTLSINYVTWRIFKDPNVQIIIVSETQKLAAHFLGSVKQRLNSPMFAEAQLRFGPPEGFKDPDGSWTQNQIYVRGKEGGHSPTVQALGVGGQIYGARADLVILDDVVTLASASRVESQVNWLSQEVLTRLPPDGGMALIAGTRVAPEDLYRFLRDEQKDWADEGEEATNVWTYLAQPAVLEYGDHPDRWVTLWPQTEDTAGNVVEMWTGRRLAKRRSELASSARWALVFQQEDVAEDATFPPGAVNCSLNRMRSPGLLNPAQHTSRQEGMQGLKVIGGVDPAASGFTAMIVGAVDRQTGKRWILDGWNHQNTTVTELWSKMKSFTEQYGITEWVIERNAYQTAMARDQEILQWMYAHGCRVREHYTGGSKWDPDFGVQSLAPLFLSCGEPIDESRVNWRKNQGGGLIDFPDPNRAPWVQSMVDQLVIWIPGAIKQRQKTDLVMALWFFEIAARDWIGLGNLNREKRFESPFAMRRDLGKRTTINLNDLEAELLNTA